jgi:cystathionine beta-lyase/cystathionine gamma-synthase
VTDPDPRPKRTRAYDPLPEWVGASTALVHGARRPERNAGAVVPPIYQTTTFHYPAEFSEVTDPADVRLYTRYGNPSQEVPAELVRSLERAEAARAFGSGMGAITSTLLTFLKPGDEVVALSDLYGGTLELLRTFLPRWGVSVRSVPPGEGHHPEEFVGSATRIVWLESPTNPLLRLHDLAAWARASHRVDALAVVDNTFATPINQRPLELGADLVVHSATKYLGGHSDVMGGFVGGPTALIERIDATHRLVGSVLDPFAGFLLTRSLRTLAVRVRQQNENGTRVAAALSTHPNVARVHYPGTASEAQEALAKRQMTGRGGMVAFEMRGGAAAARRFLHGLRLVQVAASLGGVESLVSVPGETSHALLSESELAERGIAPGLVRLSCGIEEPDDLIRDLREALDAV